MFTKCWDHATIVNYIRDLQAKGEPLYSSHVHRTYPTLHRAAFRYFGNWETAITEAGFDYAEIARYRRWSKKQIVKKLRDLWKAGEDLSWRRFSSGDHSALAHAAISKRYFGSWDAALEAAGIPVNEVRLYQSWSPLRVQRKLRQLSNAGEPLAAKHMQTTWPGLYHAACRQFGSWRDAIESIDIAYEDVACRVQRTREEVVNLLGDLKEQGVSLSDTHMRRHYPAVHASAVRYFGNWSTARRNIGAVNPEARPAKPNPKAIS